MNKARFVNLRIKRKGNVIVCNLVVLIRTFLPTFDTLLVHHDNGELALLVTQGIFLLVNLQFLPDKFTGDINEVSTLD